MTELFISDDGLTYKRIVLDKDEQLIMKYIDKDLQDISKVFSPFSQDFSFTASVQNQLAVNFFGNTTVQRANNANKYYCKVYTNGVLNLTGIIQIKEGRYKDNKLATYNAKFGTFMTNLKEVIGSDKMTAIGSAEISYKASDIAYSLQFAKVSTHSVPIKWFIPLMSNNRVWRFEEGNTGTDKDNIFWRPETDFNSDGFVSDYELRPAMSVLSILELIKAKYNLNIVAPIETRSELSEAYILCNNEKMQNTGFYPLIFPNNSLAGNNNSAKYSLSSDVASSSLKIVLNPAAPDTQNYVNFEFEINNKFSLTHKDSTGRIKIVRKGTTETLYETDFTTQDGKIIIQLIFEDNLFIGNVLEFVINTSFDGLVIHTKSRYLMSFKGTGSQRVLFTSGNIFTPFYTYADNTYTNYYKRKINIVKTLPDTPVLEFLESYLKAFNLKIYDTSPNNDKLFWLTPDDVNTNGLEYSKTTLDYTEYLDPGSYTKKAIENYNFYSFKHADSKYKSNVDYKMAAGIEYGQTNYPTTPPTDAKEYKVETKFNIIPPVFIVGTNYLPTCYGFTSDLPEITADEHRRYSPNLNELTILYKSQSYIPNGTIAVTSCNSLGHATVTQINNYITALPFNINGNSLAFSILVFQNIEYLDSLYKRGYLKQIERLINVNTLEHSFTFNLPSTETYLNESTVVQGGGNTPTGFRLQNDIIVGETKFSIIDMNIDITNGKATATFLNY